MSLDAQQFSNTSAAHQPEVHFCVRPYAYMCTVYLIGVWNDLFPLFRNYV